MTQKGHGKYVAVLPNGGPKYHRMNPEQSYSYNNERRNRKNTILNEIQKEQKPTVNENHSENNNHSVEEGIHIWRNPDFIPANPNDYFPNLKVA